jgi:ATP-dependent helicase HrpB
LRNLDALDGHGAVTLRGRAMADLPLHPRLAHMALEGKARGQGLTACALAALFEEGNVRGTGADIRPRLALILDGRAADPLVRRLQEQTRRIAVRIGLSNSPADDESPDIGLLVALAWPERVALARSPGSYLMANGRGAALPPGDPVSAHPCLAIAALDAGGNVALDSGSRDARIHLAAPLDRAELEQAFADRITSQTEVWWDEDRQAISARLRRRLDALVLSETPVAAPADLARDVLLDALLQGEFANLPWTPELTAWRQRVRFARGLSRRNRPNWPDVSDAALLATLPDWLGPSLSGIDRLDAISPELLGDCLRRLLPWPLSRRLEALAPERMLVPSGSRIALDYQAAADAADAAAAEEPDEPEGPVLAVKLQELFGLTTTPAVAGGRVPVIIHLLSPAGRLVQITRDLAGFWRHGYAAVRAELRGRYPRHPWPEDPMIAVPTRRAKPRV